MATPDILAAMGINPMTQGAAAPAQPPTPLQPTGGTPPLVARPQDDTQQGNAQQAYNSQPNPQPQQIQPRSQVSTTPPTAQMNWWNFARGLKDPSSVGAAGRLPVFENFLGNFMQALGAGFANEGHGPGAFARGLGSAMTAPYQNDVARWQAGNQASMQATTQAETEARTQGIDLQNQQIGKTFRVMGPNGMMDIPLKAMPDYFKGVGAANINAQSRLDVEKMKLLASQGQVSKVETAFDPSTGKMGKRAYDNKGNPLGFLEGAVDPTLLPTVSTDQQWKETSPGNWTLANVTKTSQKVAPGGRGGAPRQAQGITPASITPSGGGGTSATPKGGSTPGHIFGNIDVYATDPQTGRVVQTTPQEASQKGYTGVQKITGGMAKDDKSAITVLNDMTSKMDRYEKSMKEVGDLSEDDKQKVARIVNDQEMNIGIFGLQTAAGGWSERLQRDDAYKNLSSDKARKVVADYLTARSISMEIQKMESGSSRMTEIGMKIEGNQIPAPGLGYNAAKPAFDNMNSQLDTWGSKLPQRTDVPTRSEVRNGVTFQTTDGKMHRGIPVSRVDEYLKDFPGAKRVR